MECFFFFLLLLFFFLPKTAMTVHGRIYIYMLSSDWPRSECNFQGANNKLAVIGVKQDARFK